VERVEVPVQVRQETGEVTTGTPELVRFSGASVARVKVSTGEEPRASVIHFPARNGRVGGRIRYVVGTDVEQNGSGIFAVRRLSREENDK